MMRIIRVFSSHTCIRCTRRSAIKMLSCTARDEFITFYVYLVWIHMNIADLFMRKPLKYVLLRHWIVTVHAMFANIQRHVSENLEKKIDLHRFRAWVNSRKLYYTSSCGLETIFFEAIRCELYRSICSYSKFIRHGQHVLEVCKCLVYMLQYTKLSN